MYKILGRYIHFVSSQKIFGISINLTKESLTFLNWCCRWLYHFTEQLNEQQQSSNTFWINIKSIRSVSNYHKFKFNFPKVLTMQIKETSDILKINSSSTIISYLRYPNLKTKKEKKNRERTKTNFEEYDKSLQPESKNITGSM